MIVLTKNIAVLGGGSWGTALAILLAEKDYNVEMWLRDREQAESMEKNRENKRYLPGIEFPGTLSVNSSIEKILRDKDIVILAIPTNGIRDTLEKNKNLFMENQIIVNVSKGIEKDTLRRISEIVEEILPENKFAVLSGPSHAEEVSQKIPTTVVSSSKHKEIAEKVQDLFMTNYFRVYTNPDIIGVELGGSLKNIIALGAGISDGMGYGDNAKAALMTRGIFEISRLGEKMGANPITFSGLAGIGDLIVTCTSMHSRNRRAGILIGEGTSVEESIDKIGMVVEGIKTTSSAYELSKKYGISMPITEALYRVLYEAADAKLEVKKLMGRAKKNEMENIFTERGIEW